MDGAKLVRMANQIGSFFSAEPDGAAAREGVFGHLRRFWDPRMRRDLYRWLDQQGGAGLAPLVLEVVRARRAELEPAPAART
ncbi:MAG: formate dehydrogenase subunit delta [Planctomycetes bacterium]|nr:formate dehydrogenase subunit delta [Planctomycetota bacterium]